MSSSDRNSPPLPSPGAAGRRRSSFVDLFTSRPPGNANPNANQGSTPAYPGPITTAAAQAQQRRLSLSTVGLSGSPNQTSPFNNARARAGSVSSANSSSVDESPFEEGEPPSAGPQPTSPFARRLSFGARALQSVRTSNGNGNSNGRPSVIQEAVVDSSPPTTAPRAPTTSRGLSSSETSPSPSPFPTSTSPSRCEPELEPPESCWQHLPRHRWSSTDADRFLASSPSSRPQSEFSHSRHSSLTISSFAGSGQGFDYAENLRSRAERSSISAASTSPNGPAIHPRAKSVTIMEPPAAEMPQPKRPDAFQERILKGDFYMD